MQVGRNHCEAFLLFLPSQLCFSLVGEIVRVLRRLHQGWLVDWFTLHRGFRFNSLFASFDVFELLEDIVIWLLPFEKCREDILSGHLIFSTGGIDVNINRFSSNLEEFLWVELLLELFHCFVVCFFIHILIFKLVITSF